MSEEIYQELDESQLTGKKQWYVVNTYSGRERMVADYLEKRRVSQHLENNIFRIVVAEQEEIVYDKNNKPVVKKNGEVSKKIINLYPGYVFVEVIMSNQAWYVLRNTPSVTGLVGSSGKGSKPFPVPQEEIEPILRRMNLIETVIRADYKIGDEVRIIDGAFADEKGEITRLDLDNSQADVVITFFGRPNTVTVSLASIEKAD